MATKKKSPNKGKIRTIIAAAVIIYAAFTFIFQQSTINEQEKKRDELLSTQTQLEERINLLNAKLEYLHTNEYIEQTVREKLGWVKPDEIIFKVQEEEQENNEE